MDIKFSHLEYFVAVAEEQGFNRAAVRLHLSQPTLSRQIKELENQLGVTLLVRASTGTSLTPAGEAFLLRARTVLQSRETMLISMREHAGSAIKVGYIAPSLFGALGEAVAEMRKLHPDLKLEVQESAPGKQLEMLLNGGIDIAFLGHFHSETAYDVQFHELYPIPLAAVLPSSHPLASGGPIDLKDLASETFLGLHEELFPGRQAHVATACRGAGFDIAFAQLADSLISLFALIAHGQGVSLVPSCAATISYSQVTFVELTGESNDVPFLAATRHGQQNPLVEKVLQLCQAHGLKG